MYTEEEFQALIQVERAFLARQVKAAFREGIRKGVNMSTVDELVLSNLWDSSTTKYTLDEDDITVPMDKTNWSNND